MKDLVGGPMLGDLGLGPPTPPLNPALEGLKGVDPSLATTAIHGLGVPLNAIPTIKLSA